MLYSKFQLSFASFYNMKSLTAQLHGFSKSGTAALT